MIICKNQKEMRTFIAGIIDKNQLNQLISLRDAIAQGSAASRPVPEQNLHLTLEFLGEITEGQARKAEDIMDSLSFTPVPFTLDRTGCFERQDGSLVWAGSSRAPELCALQRRLHKALEEEGFKLDRRRFMPHITLLRKAVAPPLPRIATPVPGKVIRLVLFESRLRREGAEYIELHSV